MRIILVLLVIFYSSLGCSWSPHDLKLYSTRHFIELSHILVMQNKDHLKEKILAQEHDLVGCRQLNKGHGGIEAMILCMKFLNREGELKLFTSGRGKIISDINVLCPASVIQSGGLKKLIDADVLRDPMSLWAKCNTAAWRQVYLTVYANFEADPIAALAFIHKAETNLASNAFWSDKTHRLFQ